MNKKLHGVGVLVAAAVTWVLTHFHITPADQTGAEILTGIAYVGGAFMHWLGADKPSTPPQTPPQ